MRHIIALITLFSVNAYAKDLAVYIRQTNPNLTWAQSTKLEYEIYRSCHYHAVPCSIVVAILAQESKFDISRINTKTNDYGIGQINMRTIEFYNLDSYRLTHDVRYSVESSIRVLSWFYHIYSHKETLWYCRYNVGTANFDLKPNVFDMCKNYVSHLDLEAKLD